MKRCSYTIKKETPMTRCFQRKMFTLKRIRRRQRIMQVNAETEYHCEFEVLEFLELYYIHSFPCMLCMLIRSSLL